jgi:site-specific DNA-methyltransferase (adenine-specific)
MNFIKDRENKYVCARGASGRKRDGTRNTGKSEVREKWGKRFNIWNYPIGGGHSASDKIAYEHPAIFPEGLARDHIITWSNEGDTVFDPFMGSGTTGKMALLLNRKFIGVEKVGKYYQISRERITSVVDNEEEPRT